MSQQVLITGGASFVGSALGLGLAQRYPNWQITALDNLKRRGSELNLPRLKQTGIRFIHGDVRNPEDFDPTVLKPDLILECSADPSVLPGYASPGYVLQTNLVGTINCLELARQSPYFITDFRKVMSATGWQPQKDAKKTLTEIYEWIHQFKCQIKEVFL